MEQGKGSYEKVTEARDYVTNLIDHKPEIAIILGTGLGEFAEKVEKAKIIPYEEIPHFPVSTVENHKGKFILGKLSGKKVVVMQGRFHYYEGYSMNEITFPV